MGRRRDARCRIAWQFDNLANHPVSTGALESALYRIKHVLGFRSFSLRNQQRMAFSFPLYRRLRLSAVPRTDPSKAA